MIGLGVKVRDKITGFTGITVGRTEWLNGCRRYGVQAETLHEDKPIEAQWFDEQQLEIVVEQNAAAEKPLETGTRPGGPQNDPKLPTGN